MASLSFVQVLSSPRCQTSWTIFATPSFVQLKNCGLQSYSLAAVSKKKTAKSGDDDVANDGVSVEKIPKTSKRAPRRTRKKIESDTSEENTISAVLTDASQEESTSSVASSDDTKKVRRTRKKATSSLATSEGEATLSPTTSEGGVEKKVRRTRKTRKKIDDMKDTGSDSELSDHDESTLLEGTVDKKEYDLDLLTQDGEEDISFTYGWPPLVCCFGAAQHAFVPSGRPANRLIDYEIHERKKDALWAPEKFVRAPGSSSSSVAVALASLGGRVEFMGKLGSDDFGRAILYFLNVNNVQTRSISVDGKIPTAVSRMKIIRRGGLRMNCIKPCAEDSFLSSEINIDVLKEAKMFYFNSSSLLDQDMRFATLQTIKISKKLGGAIFFDLNLPLPLWQSGEETKMFIQEAWNLADIIEVTKQELEFLCGIKPSEDFDSKDNAKAKFIHHNKEMVMSLWHENLKVLFVTNGTSKIHYYTEKYNGWVHGMEDAPISPFTSDMSASGDGIVAALMRMLTVQPHLVTDKGYLESTIKYAVNCGVIDQWIQGRTRGFPPEEEAEGDLVSDPNGIRSITEVEYRTHRRLKSVS